MPPIVDSTDPGLMRLLEAVGRHGYRFVTPTPATHARVVGRAGAEWAQDLRGVLGWSLPFREGAVAAEIVAAMREARVLHEVPGGWRSAVRVSTLGETAFLHSAYPTTGEDAVFFGPDTYRFVRAIRQFAQGAGRRPVARAVDIGCGAGPGAVAVAQAWPGASVWGVDINESALRLARANGAAAGVAARFVRSDLLRGVEGAFDLIVANPPYLIDPGERTYRHGGGPLGAGLSLQILGAALDRLAPGGTLLLYTGSAIVGGMDRFGTEAAQRLAGQNVSWTYEEIDPDVFGEELDQGVYAAADRIAAVLLTATKKD